MRERERYGGAPNLYAGIATRISLVIYERIFVIVMIVVLLFWYMWKSHITTWFCLFFAFVPALSSFWLFFPFSGVLGARDMLFLLKKAEMVISFWSSQRTQR